MTPFSILYENDEILLINKPNGVSVQGGKGISHPLDSELSAQLGYKIHLVHRLDKETSGILIVAKNPLAAAKWTGMIAQKDVKKEYIAITIGKPLVDGKPSEKGRIRGTVEAHGRTQEAYLDFTVEKSGVIAAESQTGESQIALSLVHIVLGTGRMHQIRIQLAKNGAPIAADDQHGDFKKNKLLRKAGIKKLCLAAFRLTLPVDGKERVFEIPLPEHMQKAASLIEILQTISKS